MGGQPGTQPALGRGTRSSNDAVVLYVDDDLVNLRVFEANFAKNFRVVTAESGELALDIARSLGSELAVVVTDERMPVMTGTEFLKKLGEICPSAQRIVVTAYADMAAVERAVNDVGISGFYYKPWNIVELRRVIEKAVHASGLKRMVARLHSEIHRADRLTVYGLVADRVGLELTQPLTAAGVFTDVIEQQVAALTKQVIVGLGDRADDSVLELLRGLAEDAAEARGAIRDSQEIATAMRKHRPLLSNDDHTDILLAARIVGEFFNCPEVGTDTSVLFDGPAVRVRGPLVAWIQLLRDLVSCALRERPLRAGGTIQIRWTKDSGRIALRVGPVASAPLAPLAAEDAIVRAAESNDTDLDLSIVEGLVEVLDAKLEVERSDDASPRVFLVSVAAS